MSNKFLLNIFFILMIFNQVYAQAQNIRAKKIINGTIYSSEGEALHGATISYLADDKYDTRRIVGYSDSLGKFQISIPSSVFRLHFSSINYRDTIIRISSDKKNYSIVLNTKKANLDDVVISNGMFTRKKESFTGAVSIYTGDELKRIGNGNVLQSLKTLDPSFVILNNNLTGSNPNSMPNIEIRGKSSVSIANSSSLSNTFGRDPNMPLFILNGFETTLEQINDIDINRIKSVVLLKDAASTAIYGGRAANGVVVIETKAPKGGQLRVTYNNDFQTELADLSSYNMMNAAENLEFQKLAGLYATGYNSAGELNHQNEILYNERLKNVTEGVNTYWLNVPLRKIGITEGNSININGGSQEFQFDIGLNYKNINGLMKGSNRSTWGGSANLNYRVKNLNFSNFTYVNGYTSNESPYGSFSTYVNENPYFKKYNADGTLNKDRYLESFTGGQVDAKGRIDVIAPILIANPIYNATLNSKNQTKSQTITDNFGAIWTINNDFTLRVNGQLASTITHGINFISPENTIFDNVDVYQKGSYTDSRVESNSFQTNALLTYSKVLNKVHSLTGNIRGEYIQNSNESYGTTAVGFPEGSNASPYFAFQYQLNSKPAYSKSRSRSVSLLGSFNYSYNLKYYADLTYRLDGVSNFGSNKRYSPFYSVGLGWNVNRERFLSDVKWISFLRLRANYGITGNQNLGNYSSNTTYGFLTEQNLYGQGYSLLSLGLPDLAWQKNYSFSSGVDIGLLQNKLNLTVNYYNKFTNPLILNIDLPGSTGQSSTYLNSGNLRTQGFEYILKYSPIYNLEKNIVWTISLNGVKNFSRYGGGVQNLLGSLNSTANDSVGSSNAGSYLQRYYDGYSPDELWAVRSLGIDPVTGKEVFLNSKNEATYTYSAQDVKPLGTSQPVIQGVFGNSFSYKAFSLSLYLRYSFGARIFNDALYSKVENISFADLQNNQDKRALELRWKNVGDNAQFSAINIYSSTPMSSRFIQKENYISGESISVSCDLQSKQYPWVRRLGLNALRLTGYLNDIFRYSNIRTERGISYPYSKVVAFTLTANF